VGGLLFLAALEEQRPHAFQLPEVDGDLEDVRVVGVLYGSVDGAVLAALTRSVIGPPDSAHPAANASRAGAAMGCSSG
jgi:hypothetical protein